ncbi:glycosyltransferase family 39 protein [Pseudomonas syringae group sp. J309-1]|uniref:glycosyltransferase family 39 protein n=1 Tax=Pseudomonas syringae group sp. J309-1 TaxID=3079588 RepID=UPI002909C39B|nr:glycosyltransferase family 39 protein [Pseudomonas syringae group sp. J309-1]MDU8359887.1 glycosyltransferase family 39 protein [Pseudomonas syringae group sp. J309-1]
MQPASRLVWLGKIIRDYKIFPIVVVAVSVRLYGITYSAVWFDEAYSVLISETTPSLIRFHTAQDVHPPLYYFLLHFWMMFFGESVFSIRVMSALMGTLTVLVSVWLMGMIASRRAAILAGFLSALLPIAVRYSQEARMYALLALCCIAATLMLVYWVKKPEHHRYLCAYAFFMVSGFYTHYFAFPCLVVHWLYLLFVRDRGQFLIRKGSWWIANLAMLVLYLPWIPLLIEQLGRTGGVGWIPPMSLLTVISQIWIFFTLEPSSNWPIMAYLFVPLLAILVGWGLLKRDPDSHRFNLLIVLYTYGPILSMALVSLKVPLFWTRYFLFSAMGLPLLIALSLDHLMNRSFRIGFLCLIAVVGAQAGGLYNVYSGTYWLNNPYQRYETGIDKVVSYMNAQWAAGDRVLVYGSYLYPGAIYYSRRRTMPLLYTPGHELEGRPGRGSAGSFWYEDADTLYMDSYTSVPVDTQRVWFIYETDLSTFDVPDHWRPISHFTSGDTQVWLYSLNPFHLANSQRGKFHAVKQSH